MCVLPRAFAPDLDSAQDRVQLDSDESAHLTRVLRLKSGARVLVFDGRGRQHAAEIVASTKQAVTLSVLEPVPAAPEPRTRLTLAQAVIKGDKMDAVVRDATMMGIAALVPLVTERTVVPWSAVEQGRLLDRWRRVAVASAKQCGRAVVPIIEPACRFHALFTPPRDERLLLQLVEPSAVPTDAPSADAVSADTGSADAALASATSVEAASADTASVDTASVDTASAGAASASTGGTAGDRPVLPEDAPPSVLLAIGPEGGWSPEEIALAAQAGCRPWTLGARTLRAESAPLAALSVLTWVWRL